MLSLLFNILFVILIFSIILIMVFNKFISKKFKRYFLPISILLIILIPAVGHSTFIQKWQVKREINSFNTDDVNFRSDKNAINELHQLKHPIDYGVLSIQNGGSNVCSYLIKASENHKKYKIRFINYTEPFHWVPFNDYRINQINEAK